MTSSPQYEEDLIYTHQASSPLVHTGPICSLSENALVGSMSRKDNCWDNAAMERFVLNLKMERVWQKGYANHTEAIMDIADYIVNFYNAVRMHSTLGNLSPIAFEHQTAINKPIVLSEIT